MTWADYAIIGIILVSALIGTVRGFVREVVSTLIWTVGFWLALRFAGMIGNLFTFVHDSSSRLAVGFGVILAGILIVGMLVNFMLRKLVETTGASVGDRSLGTLFGAARGVVIAAGLVLLGSLTTLPQRDWWQRSRLIPYAQPLVAMARRFTPAHFAPLEGIKRLTQPVQPTESEDP
jgi:membrane protein required for colicin V production